MMKKIAFVVLACALLLASCVRQQDVTFTGVKDVELQLPSAVELSVGIENRSAQRLHLLECSFDVAFRSQKIVSIRLARPVTVERRFAGTVPVELRLRFTDPLAALGAFSRIEQQMDQVTVTGTFTVRAGWQKKTVHLQDESLLRFLSNFGALI